MPVLVLVLGVLAVLVGIAVGIRYEGSRRHGRPKSRTIHPLLLYVLVPPVGLGAAFRRAADLLRDSWSEHPDAKHPRHSDYWPPQ